MKGSACWERLHREINADDSLAHLRCGDIEGSGCIAPCPACGVTVVLPPMHDSLFCCLVVCMLGVIGPAMDTSPTMRLTAIVFQHHSTVRLGVTCIPVHGDVIVAADMAIVALRGTGVNPIYLSGSSQEGFL